MKILLTTTSFQDTPGKHHDLLNSQGFEIDTLRGPVGKDVLLPIIGDYDAVICGDDDYDAEVLKKGKNGKLKYISKYGVGLDKIDLDTAAKLGIPVTNCPGVNQISVAEHVFALILTFEKHIHIQHNSTQAKSWKRQIGNEIFGKTMGIIGLGAIGKEVAKRGAAFGLNVLAFDINEPTEFLKEYPQVIFVKDLDRLFAEADIISLHLPSNEKTQGIIGEEAIFNKIHKVPLLVNTARGNLVDSQALLKGLDEGKIKGYLTDVLEQEPILDDEVLLGHEKIIITPHVGSRTYQSVERQGSMAVNNLINLLKEAQ